MLKKYLINNWEYLLCFVLIGMGLQAESFSQEKEFNNKELSVIHLQASEVLVNYERIINELGRAIVYNPARTKEVRESFMEIVLGPKIWLFNDLDPTYQLSPYFEAETYINNLELYYPDGIEIDLFLEEALVGEVQAHGNNNYSLDFNIKKQLYGNYMNRQYNTNVETLLYKIGFTLSGKEPQNFKIVGISDPKAETIPNFEKEIQELNSKEIDVIENDAIETGIQSLINDYSNYISLIGNVQETEMDKDQYGNSFKTLFLSEDVQIYNDLAPGATEEFVSIETYLDILRLSFPDGISEMSIIIDSILFNNVVPTGNKSFQVSIDIDKFFSAKYRENEVIRNLFSLTLEITFTKSGKTYEKFLIKSIKPETEDFLMAEDSLMHTIQAMIPLTRKGVSFEIYGSYGPSAIENHSLMGPETNENQYNWSYEFEYAYTLGFGVLYSFNNHISLGLGTYYNQYKSTYSLNGVFIDDLVSFDVNNDEFHKNILSEYDSTLDFRLISIPLNLIITTSKPGETGMFFTIGGVFSYAMKGSYNTSGSWSYYGHYRGNPSVIEYMHFEELGFYSDDNIQRDGYIEGGQLNFSARASLGISIPVKYFTQITLGPEIEWGFYDFNLGRAEPPGIFGEAVSHHPTYLYKVGIRLGITFKL